MKSHRVRLCGWVLLLVVTLLASGAAQADGNIDLLDTLHNNHVITDAQYAQLKKKEQSPSAESRPASAPATASAQPQSSEAISGWRHLPQIDGYGQFDLPLSVGDAGKLGSRTVLRRFYVHIHDKIAPDWSYTTTFGYYNGAPYFASGDMTYSGLKLGGRRLAITGGYFKEPFSLSYLTSPANLLFPERPLVVMALVPNKKIGVQLATHGARWTVAGGVFGGGYNQTADPGVEGRWGESLRATVTPWLGHDSLWEVGASFAWREADSNHVETFGYQPESLVVGTRLANAAGIAHVSWFSTTGAETLAQAGPFALQAEYLLTHVGREGAAQLTFPGWYAQASWSLTGEKRHFSPSKGTMGGLVPQHTISSGGWGSWELAARYSALDLNDADVSGGFERNVSFGINWYPEKPLKFMLDAIRVLPVHGGSNPQQSTTIVMMRLQAAY